MRQPRLQSFRLGTEAFVVPRDRLGLGNCSTALLRWTSGFRSLTLRSLALAVEGVSKTAKCRQSGVVESVA